jgi:hypothetical protein
MNEWVTVGSAGRRAHARLVAGYKSELQADRRIQLRWLVQRHQRRLNAW